MGTSRILEEAKRQTLFFSSKSFEANDWQFFTFRMLVVEELQMVSILSNLRLQLFEFRRVEKRERSPFLLCVA